MSYWNTSAILKLYVREPDSQYFLDLVSGSDGPLITAQIARVEVLCALNRKESAGDLVGGAAANIYSRFVADVGVGRILLLPLVKEVLEHVENVVSRSFSPVPALPIRSLDAIHVGTALSSKSTDLVTTDASMRTVANVMGLRPVP